MKEATKSKLRTILEKKAREKYFQYCSKNKLIPVNNIKIHFSTEFEQEIYIIDIDNKEVICSLESL